jgi:hypothetical protein
MAVGTGRELPYTPPVPPLQPHRNPDGKDACHLGANLKDLARKWFAFSKMGMGGIDFSNLHNIFLTSMPQLAVSS